MVTCVSRAGKIQGELFAWTKPGLASILSFVIPRRKLKLNWTKTSFVLKSDLCLTLNSCCSSTCELNAVMGDKTFLFLAVELSTWTLAASPAENITSTPAAVVTRSRRAGKVWILKHLSILHVELEISTTQLVIWAFALVFYDIIEGIALPIVACASDVFHSSNSKLKMGS